MCRILDVGCSTGCIGISLAAAAVKSVLDTKVHVTALDIDPVAISVSRENAKRILGSSTHDQQYAVHHVAATADYHPRNYEDNNNSHDEALPFLFDMVISNPPYIPPGEMDTLDAAVLNYESHDALCSGNDDPPDGLQIIRQIIHQFPHWCKPGASCWMEVQGKERFVQLFVI